MVGHQHVGMYGAAMPLRGLVQQRQIGEVVIWLKETGLAIVPTLDDVLRDAREIGTRGTRHGRYSLEATSNVSATSSPRHQPIPSPPVRQSRHKHQITVSDPVFRMMRAIGAFALGVSKLGTSSPRCSSMPPSWRAWSGEWKIRIGGSGTLARHRNGRPCQAQRPPRVRCAYPGY